MDIVQRLHNPPDYVRGFSNTLRQAATEIEQLRTDNRLLVVLLENAVGLLGGEPHHLASHAEREFFKRSRALIERHKVQP